MSYGRFKDNGLSISLPIKYDSRGIKTTGLGNTSRDAANVCQHNSRDAITIENYQKCKAAAIPSALLKKPVGGHVLTGSKVSCALNQVVCCFSTSNF